MSEQRHKATLNKYERTYEKEKAEAEALEKAMKKGLASALKQESKKAGLQKQFAEDLEKMREDPMGARQPRKISGFNQDLEPDPTGYEEYPWQKEDDED